LIANDSCRPIPLFSPNGPQAFLLSRQANERLYVRNNLGAPPIPIFIQAAKARLFFLDAGWNRLSLPSVHVFSPYISLSRLPRAAAAKTLIVFFSCTISFDNRADFIPPRVPPHTFCSLPSPFSSLRACYSPSVHDIPSLIVGFFFSPVCFFLSAEDPFPISACPTYQPHPEAALLTYEYLFLSCFR